MGVEVVYQLAATRALPLTCTLLEFWFLRLCFTVGREERFFFFWSSRPIVVFYHQSCRPSGDFEDGAQRKENQSEVRNNGYWREDPKFSRC